MTAATRRTQSSVSWEEANQGYLVAEFARLRAQLAKSKAPLSAKSRGRIEPPPAIDAITDLFGLSPFEREILLLCAGVEMDSALAAQCAEMQGNPQRTAPTFGLALASLAQPHWSALLPSGPLRRFRLIDVDAAHGLTPAPLRIDERILHALAGINRLDGRLASILTLAQPATSIAEEHNTLAENLASFLAEPSSEPHLLHLCGDDLHGQQDTAARAVLASGHQLFILRAEDIPSDAADLEQLLLLWTRESALLKATLLVQAGSADLSPTARRFVERVPGHALLSSRQPIQLNRAMLSYEVNKPQPSEQKRLWQQALGRAAKNLNGFLDDLAGQFRLSARTIRATGSLSLARNKNELWSACRALSRPRLEDLAQRIVPAADWNDLILPEPQMLTLHQIAAQVRSRMKVYETWGFSDKGRRGLGVTALFAGESGTGKTLAAEVVARELALDLYRIDLSSVVSKYIGETEKNLHQIFDAAEEGGVLLLFDEADALFGKRSDVKDSHDRYANLEVSYLLQRMEAYQGLAVLTTNLKSSLDRAFQRRMRFIIHFPFPDVAEREAIWRRAFPTQAPTRDLDPVALAQLKLPGGSIRNIALNAAFLAAEDNHPIEMAHILQAAKLESQKLDRPISEAEIRGWS